MALFDFEHYEVKGHDSYPGLDDYVPELTIPLIPEKEWIIRQAGFDPATTTLVGLLRRDWQGHLARSILVAPDLNFSRGVEQANRSGSVIPCPYLTAQAIDNSLGFFVYCYCAYGFLGPESVS